MKELIIQKKIFKNKKGINDMSILSIIMFIFLLTSIMIPYVNSEFDTEYSNLDKDGIIQDVKDDAETITTLSAFKVLKNIMLLALFDFGNVLKLPFWLDAVYSILALIFILVIGRNLWIGGGG